MENIKIKAAVKINKPVEEVFNAFTDNNVINKYFVISASSPITAAGEKVEWQWTGMKTEIKITDFIRNKSVSFSWPGHKVDYDIHCRIDFEEKDGKTLVTVTEEGWKKDDDGIKSSNANTEGWTDMLLSMKAWLEYGIDLRK